MSGRDGRDICEWRKRIDELDLRLLRLLNERAGCAIAIGRIKRELSIPVYDPDRESEIVRLMIENNNGPLDAESLRRLFERIIDESRRIERVTSEGKSEDNLRERGIHT